MATNQLQGQVCHAYTNTYASIRNQASLYSSGSGRSSTERTLNFDGNELSDSEDEDMGHTTCIDVIEAGIDDEQGVPRMNSMKAESSKVNGIPENGSTDREQLKRKLSETDNCHENVDSDNNENAFTMKAPRLSPDVGNVAISEDGTCRSSPRKTKVSVMQMPVSQDTMQVEKIKAERDSSIPVCSSSLQSSHMIVEKSKVVENVDKNHKLRFSLPRRSSPRKISSSLHTPGRSSESQVVPALTADDSGIGVFYSDCTPFYFPLDMASLVKLRARSASKSSLSAVSPAQTTPQVKSDSRSKSSSTISGKSVNNRTKKQDVSSLSGRNVKRSKPVKSAKPKKITSAKATSAQKSLARAKETKQKQKLQRQISSRKKSVTPKKSSQKRSVPQNAVKTSPSARENRKINKVLAAKVSKIKEMQQILYAKKLAAAKVMMSKRAKLTPKALSIMTKRGLADSSRGKFGCSVPIDGKSTKQHIPQNSSSSAEIMSEQSSHTNYNLMKFEIRIENISKSHLRLLSRTSPPSVNSTNQPVNEDQENTNSASSCTIMSAVSGSELVPASCENKCTSDKKPSTCVAVNSLTNIGAISVSSFEKSVTPCNAVSTMQTSTSDISPNSNYSITKLRPRPAPKPLSEVSHKPSSTSVNPETPSKGIPGTSGSVQKSTFTTSCSQIQTSQTYITDTISTYISTPRASSSHSSIVTAFPKIETNVICVSANVKPAIAESRSIKRAASNLPAKSKIARKKIPDQSASLSKVKTDVVRTSVKLPAMPLTSHSKKHVDENIVKKVTKGSKSKVVKCTGRIKSDFAKKSSLSSPKSCSSHVHTQTSAAKVVISKSTCDIPLKKELKYRNQKMRITGKATSKRQFSLSSIMSQSKEDNTVPVSSAFNRSMSLQEAKSSSTFHCPTIDIPPVESRAHKALDTHDYSLLHRGFGRSFSWNGCSSVSDSSTSCGNNQLSASHGSRIMSDSSQRDIICRECVIQQCSVKENVVRQFSVKEKFSGKCAIHQNIKRSSDSFHASRKFASSSTKIFMPSSNLLHAPAAEHYPANMFSGLNWQTTQSATGATGSSPHATPDIVDLCSSDDDSCTIFSETETSSTESDSSALRNDSSALRSKPNLSYAVKRPALELKFDDSGMPVPVDGAVGSSEEDVVFMPNKIRKPSLMLSAEKKKRQSPLSQLLSLTAAARHRTMLTSPPSKRALLGTINKPHVRSSDSFSSDHLSGHEGDDLFSSRKRAHSESSSQVWLSHSARSLPAQSSFYSYFDIGTEVTICDHEIFEIPTDDESIDEVPLAKKSLLTEEERHRLCAGFPLKECCVNVACIEVASARQLIQLCQHRANWYNPELLQKAGLSIYDVQRLHLKSLRGSNADKGKYSLRRFIKKKETFQPVDTGPLSRSLNLEFLKSKETKEKELMRRQKSVERKQKERESIQRSLLKINKVLLLQSSFWDVAVK